MSGEEDDEEGDPVERLPLDLLVVLLPQLQLPVRLGQAEEDLGEAEFSKRQHFYQGGGVSGILYRGYSKLQHF